MDVVHPLEIRTTATDVVFGPDDEERERRTLARP